MRVFGLDEARQHVPFLIQTFQRVRALLDEARAMTSKLDTTRVSEGEERVLREEINGVTRRIRDELMRLEEAGIEVKAVDGLVDFRAQLGDRQVYLCWKFPEETITFWHELHTGFAGRQEIDEHTQFAPTFPS